MTTRVVPQILPSVDLVSPAGLPLGSLAFPAAGGAQLIDLAGNVEYVLTSPDNDEAALLGANQTFSGTNIFSQTVTIDGNLAFATDYLISIPSVPTAPDIGTAGSDLKLTLHDAMGQILLGAANGGKVQVGGNPTAEVGFYGVPTVAQAAAITAPTPPGAVYAQAEAQSMEAAVNAIIAALQGIGITL